jgi:hypothetical protein
MIFAAEGDATERALRRVVVDRDRGVIEEGDERVPSSR